jgi:antitoxin MazE
VQVSKWGNSLAVRLPAHVVETLRLKEGDDIDLRVDMDNTLSLAVVKQLSRPELHEKLKRFEGMRPADYVFDRDEANER